MYLNDFFKEYREVAIAFSGGTDSAFLCFEALNYAKKVKAYYVKTLFQPEFELRDALKFADEYHLDLCIIECDILKEEIIASNPSDRCYYCKKTIMQRIINRAVKDGFEILLDGTNASDDSTDRPGMKALEELKILSPLKICGLSKKEIRNLSKEAGLFTWDKPAYACLATRIPTGEQITPKLLSITEQSEKYLSSLGFFDFRVRFKEGGALIQLKESQFALYRELETKITEELEKQYDHVSLDSNPR